MIGCAAMNRDTQVPRVVPFGILPLRTLAHPCASQHAQERPLTPRSYDMGKVKNIEHQVAALSPDELASFREWFAAFDAEAWDRQFEADVAAGKLASYTRSETRRPLLCAPEERG